MKKISLILAVVLAVTLSFGMAAFAADCSQSKLISDLSVKSPGADDWTVVPDAKVGMETYTDRGFKIQTLSDELVGAELLRPACNSKNFVRSDSALATFKAVADFDLYVASDSRIWPKNKWFKEAGLEKTELTVVDDAASPQVTYQVYKKSIKAGEEVSLGINGQSGGCIQYIVFLKPATK